ncbi:hypothetical protein U1Q18_014760, partial [Sarracenia purpurea var. burkii]
LCLVMEQRVPPERPKLRMMEEDGVRDHNKSSEGARGVASQMWHQKGQRCPKGTIPIRRSTLHDVLRAKSLYDFGKKQPRSTPLARAVDAPDVVTGNGHEVCYYFFNFFFEIKSNPRASPNFNPEPCLLRICSRSSLLPCASLRRSKNKPKNPAAPPSLSTCAGDKTLSPENPDHAPATPSSRLKTPEISTKLLAFFSSANFTGTLLPQLAQPHASLRSPLVLAGNPLAFFDQSTDSTENISEGADSTFPPSISPFNPLITTPENQSLQSCAPRTEKPPVLNPILWFQG